MRTRLAEGFYHLNGRTNIEDAKTKLARFPGLYQNLEVAVTRFDKQIRSLEGLFQGIPPYSRSCGQLLYASGTGNDGDITKNTVSTETIKHNDVKRATYGTIMDWALISPPTKRQSTNIFPKDVGLDDNVQEAYDTLRANQNIPIFQKDFKAKFGDLLIIKSKRRGLRAGSVQQFEPLIKYSPSHIGFCQQVRPFPEGGTVVKFGDSGSLPFTCDGVLAGVLFSQLPSPKTDDYGQQVCNALIIHMNALAKDIERVTGCELSLYPQ